MQDYVLSEICDQNALELREVLQVLLGCHGAGVRWRERRREEFWGEEPHMICDVNM